MARGYQFRRAGGAELIADGYNVGEFTADGGGRARCPPGPRGLTAGTAASRDAALGW